MRPPTGGRRSSQIQLILSLVFHLLTTNVPPDDRFIAAYEVKYDRRPRNENIGEVYLFRLARR